MQEERIEVGAIIVLRKKQFTISEALPDGRLKLEALDGETSPMAETRTKLERAYVDGHLEFPLAAWVEDLDRSSSAPRLTQDLTQLPESFQKETRRRADYVRAVLKKPGLGWDKRQVQPILDAVSARLADGGAPSPSTVQRWYQRYVAADKDIRALIPRTKWRGSRRRRLHPVVVQIVNAMIERHYLTSERGSGGDVHGAVEDEIRRANWKRDEVDQLAVPSLRWIYNEIGKLDPYHVCSRRFGKPYADRKFTQTGRGIIATRPLERVEVDHTKADLMVIDDETRLPIGRPWITALLDKFSRMVYGIYISFTPPSYVSVMHALRHGILPKAELREAYPEIENDWPIYGKPEVLVCDNGPEFLSRSFEETLNDIGTELELNDPGSPHQKGAIERFLGRVNRGLLQSQPGTTFSNIFDLKDYDPVKNAVIPLSVLKRIVFRYICDYYHVQYHRGLGGQPLAVYQEAARKYPPPALPRSAKELTPLLSKVEERQIHHYGIEILGLKYNRPELAAIRHRMGKQKAKIRINENDLAEIYVWDEFEQRYIPVLCTDPEYAQGLTLWQHKVIRRNVIKEGKDPVDSANLARVRREIQELVNCCWSKRTKTGHKQKAARWLQGASAPGDQVSLQEIADVSLSMTASSDSANESESIEDEAELMRQLISDGWGIDPTTTNHPEA